MSGLRSRILAPIAVAVACICGIALVGAVPSLAGAPPLVERQTAARVTTLSSEQLAQLPGTRDYRTILDYHNQLRAQVGSRPLRWNPELAAGAAAYGPVLSQGGSLQHASREGREKVRENLLQSLRGTSVQQMVQVWGNERRLFRPGIFPNVSADGNWASVGHYTQMIWPTTTDVGCAIYTDARFSWLICRYAPPGNKDGVVIGTTPRLAGGLCTSPGGNTIPCDNGPQGPKVAGGGETVQDDGGGRIDTTVKDEVACIVDVNVHRPISVDPDETVIPDATELDPGATTLRNDDSDWHLGAEPARSELPVVSLPTDIARANNPDENDLVRVDGVNAAGLPNVYLFAFPTHVEANRDLGTAIGAPNPVGRHAVPAELGYYTSATKGGVAPALPVAVPAAGVSFWTEAKLGGRYRMVIGQLVPGIQPADVRYDRDTGKAYYMKEKNKEPAFVCEDQATVTAAVIDIFQRRAPNAGVQRLTAFDVYWAGRPHFRAEVWPGGQAYTWGTQYRLGATPHPMPGQAVGGVVASMVKDAEDGEDTRARLDGPRVRSSGNAPGGFGQKERIEGGFQIDSPQAGNVPTVNTNAADRYPDRVSLEYVVNGEHLVRPEYLQVILPRIRAPAAPPQPEAGSARGARSGVSYTIVDGFDRVIKVGKDETITDYLYLYGSGIKAWEALGGQAGRVVESGPTLDRNRQPRPDRYNDHLYITNTGLDGSGNRRPPIGPLGTAQRSQASVLPNRMTEGIFQDTLVFDAGSDADARKALWSAARGLEGATPQATRQNQEQAQAEARARDDALNDRANPADKGLSAADRRAAVQRRHAAVPAADQGRVASSSVMAIPQDVILQMRVGAARHDLMVFQGNTLSILAPYFFDNSQYPGDKNDAVFRYHMQFTPGTATSQIVGANHRRPGN